MKVPPVVSNPEEVKLIIELLNKKTTTTKDVLDLIKQSTEEFQVKRENFYTTNFLEKTSNSAKLTDEELDRATKQIVENIVEDTKRFVELYVSEVTDHILDAINSKKIKSKKAAHNFLIMLQSVESVYMEDSSNENV